MIKRIEKINKKTKKTYFSVPFDTLRGEIPSKMTPEMWEVYRIIEDATNKGKTISVKEICDLVPFYRIRSTHSGNYSNCPELYEDIFLINTLYSNEHDKFILTNSNHFKLATEDEAIKKRNKIAVKFTRLKWEYDSLTELCDRDKQYKLLSNQGRPYDLDHESSYKESFVEDND